MKNLVTRLPVAAVVLILCCGHVAADITDFTTWSLIEDPPNGNFSGDNSMSSQASLFAAGPVPINTDIGFASVDGNTVPTSSVGFFFDRSSDFHVAIDYDLSFVSASGALGLGFGVGEDQLGMNSAGVGMVTNDGSPFLNFTAAARTNDVTTLETLGESATLAGSLFVRYDAASGDLIVGASPNPGAANPADSFTFSGLQNGWTDENLLASFFIRSQQIPLVAPDGWEGGDATAVFTNFRILDGSALAIPEPSSLLIAAGMSCCWLARRRR